jgi:hypothetical protein
MQIIGAITVAHVIATSLDSITKIYILQKSQSSHYKMLDIAYLTIHVDAGAMAFSRRKYLPPRLAAKTFW